MIAFKFLGDNTAGLYFDNNITVIYYNFINHSIFTFKDDSYHPFNYNEQDVECITLLTEG